MKLNKNGWGLWTFLIFIAIFIIGLLFSAWGFKQLGLLDEDYHFVKIEEINKVKEETVATYSNLEAKMVESSKNYIKDFYGNGFDGTLVVTAKNLKESGYLDSLQDRKGRNCSGYVSASKENEEIVYTSYLKCKRYKTKGYEKRKDEK